MDYSTTHFGKPLKDITLDDVKLFFQQDRTETDQIEFKSINPKGELQDKFAGIQKSVCAFLNSSGGLLIWGAPKGESVPGRKEKVFNGDLTYFDTVIEKDFLISKISDSIIPLPNNVRARILEDEGRTIALVEVDASDYAPHQTDHTYYMRIDGQSKPAPHHYIEALFKRIKYPEIEAFLKLYSIEDAFGVVTLTFKLFFCNWSPLQNEEGLYYRLITTEGELSMDSKPRKSQPKFTRDSKQVHSDDIKAVFYYGEPISEIVSLRANVGSARGIQRIVLAFGGRTSPMKTSVYQVDFSKIGLHDVEGKNVPKDVLITVFENKLMKDFQDELGSTKEIIIKGLME